jgi:hypothetical protein
MRGSDIPCTGGAMVESLGRFSSAAGMINIALRSMVSRGGFARLEESDVLLYDGAITKSDKESNLFTAQENLPKGTHAISRVALQGVWDPQFPARSSLSNADTSSQTCRQSKWHLHDAHSKRNVTSRFGAMARARTLGIV